VQKVTFAEFPELKRFVTEILGIFKANADKTKAHEISKPLLEAMTHNPQVMTEIIRLNIAQPGFFNRTHYPSPSMQVARTPYFDFVVNCWIPLPDKVTNISTKALHHHGPMLLSTATAFGPGYEHWMLTFPQPIDHEQELFRMDLIEAAPHRLHHVSFVDKYIVHVPMYVSTLSITYALWSNSRPTTWKDRMKALPMFRRNAALLRNVGKKLGLTKTLDLKMEEYLDYYPVNGGFKGVRNRDDVEFKRGPVSDYLPSIFHIFQETGNAQLAEEIKGFINHDPDLSEENRKLALSLVQDLTAGRPIPSKLTDGLHYGFYHSNFTRESIEHALQTQPATELAKECAVVS
jgi:hypothetical protein